MHTVYSAVHNHNYLDLDPSSLAVVICLDYLTTQTISMPPELVPHPQLREAIIVGYIFGLGLSK